MRVVLIAKLLIPLGLDRYLPAPEENPLTPAKIEAGRRLFFDRRLSRDGSISCASCHDPTRAFSDGRAIAVGIEGRIGIRNAPAIVNRGYGQSFFWDGRAATLEEQVLQPITNPDEMGSTASEAARRVGMSERELSFALASYVRSILSGNSRVDRFVSGQHDVLTDSERRGFDIYRGKGGCATCHPSPTFTDEHFHNTGVAWDGHQLRDPGRFAVTGRDADRGAFKTPTLRDLPLTAPYMHDGSLATLEDVVDFYDRGGRPNPHLDADIRPLRLGSDEKAALIEFLKALEGKPVLNSVRGQAQVLQSLIVRRPG